MKFLKGNKLKPQTVLNTKENVVPLKWAKI